MNQNNNRQKSKACIKAVAAFLPDQILSNADLEKIVETSDEWIVERVGIKERRIAPKDKPTSWMATQVAEKLLLQSGLSALDVDGIIVATITPDMFFPNTSNKVLSNIKAHRAWSYDSMAACSGFIYALSQATAFIESGRAKNIMVIGADKMSSIVDFKDRNTCILFGDAAAGVLVSQSDDENGIHDFIIGVEEDTTDALHMKGGGSSCPASLDSVSQDLHYVRQEGRIVFKRAIQVMSEITGKIISQNHLSVNDIDWLVPHQANKRIISNVGDTIGIDPSRVMMNIQKYGNTTAATIPLCLWDYSDKIKKGDKIVATAFGAGFTYGSVYFTWSI